MCEGPGFESIVLT